MQNLSNLCKHGQRMLNGDDDDDDDDDSDCNLLLLRSIKTMLSILSVRGFE